MSTERLGVLASGRGSNFEAILNHIELGVLENVEVRYLISDNRDARALQVAEKNEIPNQTVEPKEGEKGKEFEKRISEIFEKSDVSLVILAGFMRIVSPYLIEKYRGKIMNIHPALLPSFKGLDAQRQALNYGVKVSGCTVHYASEEVDAGPIILQHPVPVLEDDTEDALSDRILVFEHRLYSKAIQLHADDRLEIVEGRVRIDLSGNWEENWREKQEVFIDRQKEVWEEKEVFGGVWE